MHSIAPVIFSRPKIALTFDLSESSGDIQQRVYVMIIESNNAQSYLQL